MGSAQVQIDTWAYNLYTVYTTTLFRVHPYAVHTIYTTNVFLTNPIRTLSFPLVSPSPT